MSKDRSKLEGAVTPEPPDRDDSVGRLVDRPGTSLSWARSGPGRPPSWLAVTLVVALIVAATVGVGERTGWTFVSAPGAGPSGPTGGQDCRGIPYYLSSYFPGAVGATSGASWATALHALGGVFSNWTGHCTHVEASVSSGDGYVPELAGSSADFALGGAPPNVSDRSALPGSVAVLPDLLTATDVVYDLPGLTVPLRLNGTVIAGIYTGAITSWSDPRIEALNPKDDLAAEPTLVPLYRSDAASINLALSTYLSNANATWNRTLGAGTTVAWPVGVAEDGPGPMAGRVAATAGAIGYLEGVDARSAAVRDAVLENPSGDFVGSGAANVTAAAEAVASSPGVGSINWTTIATGISLVDAAGAHSYPVVELGYLTLYRDLGPVYGGSLSDANAIWLVAFFWWTASGASVTAPTLGLAPIPPSFERLSERLLQGETYYGSPLAGQTSVVAGTPDP